MDKITLIIFAFLLIFAVGCKKKNSEKKTDLPVSQGKITEIKSDDIVTNLPAKKIIEPTGPPTNKIYLADMRGKVNFRNVYGKPRWGMDLSGKVIRYNGKMYRKGITTHPPKDGEAVGICPLNKKYRKFQSFIFVNSEKGVASFRVVADGKELFNSGELTGKDNPLFIDVDVTGVEELRMIVNKGKDNYSDHAVWGDPVLWY